MYRKVSIKKKRVTLHFVAEPGKQILIAGSFNRWYIQDPKSKNARPLKEDEAEKGKYSVMLFLPLGTHEYKFFYDGEWHLDPNAKDKALNEFGSFNSVITVA